MLFAYNMTLSLLFPELPTRKHATVPTLDRLRTQSCGFIITVRFTKKNGPDTTSLETLVLPVEGVLVRGLTSDQKRRDVQPLAQGLTSLMCRVRGLNQLLWKGNVTTDHHIRVRLLLQLTRLCRRFSFNLQHRQPSSQT